MIQPFIDLIERWIHFFLPFVIVDEYEGGVILRFGKYHRTLGPGFHWVIPWNVEVCLTCNTVVTTMDLDPQSITTADGKSIVVSAVVKYRIMDAKKYLLEVYDQQSAIQDITMAKIREVMGSKSWAEISSSTDLQIASGVRTEVAKYGIKIQPKGVVLKDLQVCRSIRLLQDMNPTVSITNE